MIARPLRLGMVGGASGAFMGPVHAMAAKLDGCFEIVAGAFSADAQRSVAAAAGYGVAAARAYPDYAAMFAAEASRADGMEVASIVTPNHLHYPVACAALAAGCHVICDKPLALSLAEARDLAVRAAAAGRHVAVTYTYAGFAMVRQARAMVAAGQLGTIRRIVVQYAQGWLSQPDDAANKQAAWRTDPARAGAGGCIADIGVHAFHLAEYISGLQVAHILPDLGTVVAGRRLDDDCAVLLRFDNGARGVLLASQVATGDRNALAIAVYGSTAGLHWRLEAADALVFAPHDAPVQTIHAGSSQLCPAAQRATRLPAGHPEGYIEAFATLYRDFHTQIHDGAPPPGSATAIEHGIRGMAFIEAAVNAGAAAPAWIPLDDLQREPT
jgi:predicted dehydrogenase